MSNGQRLNHIIVEVLIDSAWRLIDPTYGAYWIDGTAGAPFALRLLEQILPATDAHTKLVRNGALAPYGYYEEIARPDFFNYLAPGADIFRGGEGEIGLSLRGSRGIETFRDIPNFLGDNIEDGNQEGVSYRIDGGQGTYKLSVNVAGSA
jgi:hypothetical protein